MFVLVVRGRIQGIFDEFCIQFQIIMTFSTVCLFKNQTAGSLKAFDAIVRNLEIGSAFSSSVRHNGQWTMDNGQWTMDNGQLWTIMDNYGQWTTAT